MFFRRSLMVALAGFLCSISTTVAAPAASTFILPSDDGTNLTFAINVPSDSQDVYFHFSAPTGYSWMAVGTGSEMKNSLMFLVYSDQSGKNITLSPRISTSHNEPVYNSSLSVTTLAGTGIINDTYVVNAKCSNCRTWNTGSLDLKSTTQPWIYALGPSKNLQSNSMTAGIQRHEEYGKFNINMVQATGDAGVPTDFTKMSGATQLGNPTQDHDYTTIVHALLTCGTFVILMPLGVVYLRVLEKVRWHWMNQTLAVIVAVLAAIVGIYLSTNYNKSKSYNSAHQIIGLVVTAFLFLQFFFGFWHHRIFKPTQATTIYAKIHQYLGQVIILAGIVNGAIGFSYADSTKYIIPYIVIVLAMCVVVFGALFWKQRRRTRKGAFTTLAAQNFDEGWIGSANQSDVNLTSYAHPPAYQGQESGIPGHNGRAQYAPYGRRNV